MRHLQTGIAMIGTAALLACSPGTQTTPQASGTSDLEARVADYIQKFPYQDTYNYGQRYTGGDPARLNTWVIGQEPALVKAGEDKVVRMNNDTFYKLAFVVLDQGPVVLESKAPSDDRFSSFQLMDDRNANYHNVIHPGGTYTLHRGARPQDVEGEVIEVPSNLSAVIVRVEVKDKNDPADVAAAEAVFGGITITGPAIATFPVVDLLSSFPEEVESAALQRLDETFAKVPFRETVVGPGQEPGRDVPYLNHSAGTKGGWGGPHASHSSYETLFFDVNGDDLDGSKGAYTVTTEEPPVDAFWSLTVYDTGRGGFLHPNEDDRYHINNTAAVRNNDGAVTFTFKQDCESADPNCLEVPAGRFDVAARYYLPHQPIIAGTWQLPGIELQAVRTP